MLYNLVDSLVKRVEVITRAWGTGSALMHMALDRVYMGVMVRCLHTVQTYRGSFPRTD